eukprot:12923247-Prorocentrum_lima.AAC.1
MGLGSRGAGGWCWCNRVRGCVLRGVGAVHFAHVYVYPGATKPPRAMKATMTKALPACHARSAAA